MIKLNKAFYIAAVPFFAYVCSINAFQEEEKSQEEINKPVVSHAQVEVEEDFDISEYNKEFTDFLQEKGVLQTFIDAKGIPDDVKNDEQWDKLGLAILAFGKKVNRIAYADWKYQKFAKPKFPPTSPSTEVH